MGELRVIHPELAEMYDQVFDRAYGYTMAGIDHDALPQLRQARQELDKPTGTLDVRERAWHNGQQAAIRDLIERAIMNHPFSGEAT